MKLGLLDQPIAPAAARAAARRVARTASTRRRADRGALLRAGRGSRRLQLRRPVRKLPRLRRAKPNSSPPCAPAGRRCGPRARCATWQRTISIPPIPPWRCCPAPGRSAAVGRRLEPHGRRRHADQRDLGARLAIAQGEVVPDRIVLGRDRASARDRCRPQGSPRRPAPRRGAVPQAVPARACRAPCLDAGAGGGARPAAAQGRSRHRHAGRDRMGARRGRASSCCRRGRCTSEPARCPTRSGCGIPASTAIPPGIGWGTGRAVVVNCECELVRVAPGDVWSPAWPGRR